MLIKTFSDMQKYIKTVGKKRLAVVMAEDEEVLAAVKQVRDEGIADVILTGSKRAIEDVAKKLNIDLHGFEIIDEPDAIKAAKLCNKLVRDGRASAIMKGMIDTSKFMKSVLDKETGLNTGNVVSSVAVFELETYPKLLFITDPAVMVAPDLEQKVKIIQNAVKVAQSLGIEKPLVACCCAVEKVNAAAMPATIDAACLAKMSDRGQIPGCIVDGPFGLDNAVSEEAAKIKKVGGPVAGKADIILCDAIESSNYLYKALVFLTKSKNALLIVGAAAPIIVTSRADSHETKYNSILLSLLCS